MVKRILIKPLVSEKAENLSEKKGQYVFVVDKHANKIEIRKAVEKAYNVTVDSVNTFVMPAKAKTRNTKAGLIKGRVSSFKKAVVKLSAGEEINLYGEV